MLVAVLNESNIHANVTTLICFGHCTDIRRFMDLCIVALNHSLIGVITLQADDQATKVWGTDINVADVRKNFSQFIRGFREQEGQDEAGIPKFKEQIKYLEYLQDVRPAFRLHYA
jgi:hypothetical protein